MNIIRRRDPLEMVGMGRMLRDFFDEPMMGDLADLQPGALPLDVSEKEDEIVVRASLPGFSPDDIDVQVHNGMLMINAEHTEEQEEEGERFHRRERRFGAVSRTVSLPTEVREDQVRAELNNGVLTLNLPKTPEARPHRIPISGGGQAQGQSQPQIGSKQQTQQRQAQSRQQSTQA